MSFVSEVKEKIVQYIDVYIKLAKISFIEGTGNILSYFMFALICLFLFFCIVLFAGLGLVEVFKAIGFTVLSSFFITMGILVLLLIFILLLRRKITRMFAGGFIKMMADGRKDDYSEDDEEE
jgi:hypothetical protein